MEILQIIVLIAGALLFTVSFFIPDKQADTANVKEKEEKIFRELMEKELPKIREKIDEATEAGIEHAKENTQRQMERLTNEKMMAINEYSDTVMAEIHKNHEEAVFLYDMLNNKHAQVKNTAAELSQVVKESKHVQSAAKTSKKEEKKEKKTSSFEPMPVQEIDLVMQPEEKKDKSPSKSSKKSSPKEKEEPIVNNVDIMFATEGNEENSNDRILELHKEGKSNMAIARELGLGIGEVKLVIDLFKGGM